MMIWSNDTMNIVRRYPPMLDTDGDGSADAKDPVGFPHLVNRIFLKSAWQTANGGAGFPLNLKSETRYNEFIAHLEGRGTGEQCIFDLNGCNLCIEYEKDDDGKDTDVCKTWELQTDDAIPPGEDCPSSFYAGKICAGNGDPDKKKKDVACDSWHTGSWKPAPDTQCQGTDFTQTRDVKMAPLGCDSSKGTPSVHKPADTQIAQGTQPAATCCTDWTTSGYDPAVPGNPQAGWRLGFDSLADIPECFGDMQLVRNCKTNPGISERKNFPAQKPNPHSWLPSLDTDTYCTTETRPQTRKADSHSVLGICGPDETRDVPGTKVCTRTDGQCGTTTNTCDAGDPLPGTGGNWTCKGVAGGADAACPGPGAPVDGICINTATSTPYCAAGTYKKIDDVEWICEGENGGNNESCENKGGTDPTNACDTCPTGGPPNFTDTGTQCCATWHNGNTIGCFPKGVASCTAPVCGVGKNTCDSGLSISTGPDTWACVTMGADGKGAAADCTTAKSCYYTCNTWYDPGGCGCDGTVFAGGCEDGSKKADDFIVFGNIRKCIEDMKKNFCDDGDNDNKCCTVPGDCPPKWLTRTDGVCGKEDRAGVRGCLGGTYQDIPGRTWMCQGFHGGNDVICP